MDWVVNSTKQQDIPFLFPLFPLLLQWDLCFLDYASGAPKQKGSFRGYQGMIVRNVGSGGANHYPDTHQPVAIHLSVAALPALCAKRLHHPSVYILTTCRSMGISLDL